MLDHFKSLFSSASTLPMFNARLGALEDVLKDYAAGPGGASKPAAGSGAPKRSKEELLKILGGTP